ncbi:MAG: S9 family peptidase [Alphaproteobacteria bacterium]
MPHATQPVAARKPVTDTRHGHARTDDYAWLRADNWQEVMRDPDVLDADIRSYLEAENALFKEQMADTDTLRETLFREMRGRIKEDDSTVPLADGPWAYAVRYVEGGQHPLMVRQPRDGGEEAVLIDGNELARDKAYFKLGGFTHAPSHGLIAWSFDDKGSEYFTVRFRDPATGADVDDIIADTGGGVVWSADSAHVFYVRMDDNHRPSKVYRHEIGTPASADVLVYEEIDPGFFVGLGKTQSARFIVIDCHDHETSEVHVIDADDPAGTPRLIAPRITGQEYSLDEAGGKYFILTNADDAKDFKIVSAPVDAPDRENWADLVAHTPGQLILSHGTFAGHMVRLERVEGLPRIVIHAFADGREHAIAFEEEAYALGLMGAYEFDTTTMRFSYSSMTTPARVFDYDMNSGDKALRKEQEVPSGHDPADYVTGRIQATAADGEQIPISLLYRRDTPLDGSAPCLLYGYGSYGITIPAGFSTSRLSLVDRGFVYAIAHVRGGKDKGFAWYEDGKRANKPNTFSDFIAIADHLVGQNITSHARIVAEGGSAGGMLMGAIANMAPDKFGGIIAAVPFVDVLTTMLDDTLPLTPPEWPEWGNPIESKADYETILAYSPYDNVAAQDYPPILVLAGLTDPRVTYWEPAKWVARLRATKRDNALLMLKTNMDAGHAGAAGRFDALKEVAIEQAFALKVVGLV